MTVIQKQVKTSKQQNLSFGNYSESKRLSPYAFLDIFTTMQKININTAFMTTFFLFIRNSVYNGMLQAMPDCTSNG